MPIAMNPPRPCCVECAEESKWALYLRVRDPWPVVHVQLQYSGFRTRRAAWSMQREPDKPRAAESEVIGFTFYSIETRKKHTKMEMVIVDQPFCICAQSCFGLGRLRAFYIILQETKCTAKQVAPILSNERKRPFSRCTQFKQGVYTVTWTGLTAPESKPCVPWRPR
jgi:hypothetical protein